MNRKRWKWPKKIGGEQVENRALPENVSIRDDAGKAWSGKLKRGKTRERSPKVRASLRATGLHPLVHAPLNIEAGCRADTYGAMGTFFNPANWSPPAPAGEECAVTRGRQRHYKGPPAPAGGSSTNSI